MNNKFILSFLALLLNNITCEQFLINSEENDLQLHRAASCAANCLSLKKRETLQSCYNFCNEVNDDGQYEIALKLQDETPDLYLVCRESEMFVLRINITDLIEKEDSNNTTNSQFVYLFKAQAIDDPFGNMSIYLTNVSIVMFRNLQPNQSYDVSATIFTSYEEIIFTHTNQIVQTMHDGYTPGNITKIHPIKFHTNPNDLYLVNADISWEPAKDLACYYEILYHSSVNEDEGLEIDYILKPGTLFEYVIKGIRLDEKYQLAIKAFTSGSETRSSDLIWFPMITPTCNFMHNYNSTLCAPDEVFGLNSSVKLFNRAAKTVTITVQWDPPQIKPEHYLFVIYEFYDEAEPLEYDLPGNITRFSINYQLQGHGYMIKLFAILDGKISKPAQEYKYFDWDWIANESEEHQSNTRGLHVVIGIIVLICILVLIIFGVLIYLWCADQHLKKENLVNEEDLEDSQGLNEIESCTDPMEIKYHTVTFLNKLGHGAFGVVKKCQILKENGIIYAAAKQLKEDPTVDEVREFRNEIKLMKSVGTHPNILAIVGHCTTNTQELTLFTEFCSKGNLRDFLLRVASYLKQQQQLLNIESSTQQVGNPLFKSNRKPYYINELIVKEEVHHTVNNQAYGLQSDQNMNENDDYRIIDIRYLLNFSQQIATGMEYLSMQRIVHRDLAARNVLVSDQLILKISDFGLSRDVYLNSMYKKITNTKLPLPWLAIESLTHREYTTRSDVWSYGILLYEICTLGGYPYPDIDVTSLIELLQTGYRMKQPVNCSADLYQLMRDCWMDNPLERPTFTEIRKRIHGFITNSIMTDETASIKMRG